jgi:hypothetical protein
MHEDAVPRRAIGTPVDSGRNSTADPGFKRFVGMGTFSYNHQDVSPIVCLRRNKYMYLVRALSFFRALNWDFNPVKYCTFFE